MSRKANRAADLVTSANRAAALIAFLDNFPILGDLSISPVKVPLKEFQFNCHLQIKGTI